MRIKSVRFFKSALIPKDWPDLPYPEIAFVGRSNVGKSSLLRTVLNQKKLIRVSHTPGCTRAINFYLINEKIFFTDLPGYGYAKVANYLQTKWAKSIEIYLAKRKQLKGIVFLLDARFGPLANDLQLWEWLNFYQKQTIIVLTKVDKIKRQERKEILQITRQKFNLGNEFPLYFFSARTAEGKHALLKAISNLLINN